MKLSVCEKGVNTLNENQQKAEANLKKCKDKVLTEKEKVRRMNVEVSRLKIELKRANRWTQSSRIVNHLGSRTQNERARLGFHKETLSTEDLCYTCGKTGHPTTECPKILKVLHKNMELVKMKTLVCDKRNILPTWARRKLIHPFDHKKGPKLVWVPKTNP